MENVDLHLRSQALNGVIEPWKVTSVLNMQTNLEVGDVAAGVTIRRGRRGATVEIRPDTSSLEYTEYTEDPGKFRYHRPRGWGMLQDGALHIDGLPPVRMQWGETQAYPDERREDWTFATVPVLAANYSHDEADELFANYGVESYANIREEVRGDC